MNRMNSAPSSPLILSQYSRHPFLLFTAYATYGAVFVVVWLVRSRHTLGTTSPEWLAGLVAALLRCVGTAFMWAIWAYKTNSNSKWERKLLAWLENSYHPLIVLSMSLRVGTEVMVGQCSDAYSLSGYVTACNDFQDLGSIHPTFLVSLMILPLLAYFITRESNIECIAVSWLIALATLIFCAIQMESQVLVYPVSLFCLGSFSIFYVTKRQNDDMLRLVAALQQTAAEVERLQEETRAMELRAMIGNVAHDLKTPLTSILSGIECIEETMTCLERLGATSATDPLPQQALPHLDSVRACLKSMLGTSSFMTMSINRCLDYTKASKGVKLVPKPETVSLQEALDFPISIMRDVQTQLPITLAPVPAEVCSHIITDKQWLMENVLCLLSNAVRYSECGSIEVRVLHQSGVSKTGNALSDVPSSICIEVWDTGVGLPESVMASLFAPFKQAQRLAGGTGLGLFSLAKRVEALRGEYGVCKRPDGAQGSMFWFSIPYRPDHASSATSLVRHPDPTAFSPCRAPSTTLLSTTTSFGGDRPCLAVLVVDDAPTILKMTAMLLTKKGHSVEKAVNGAQAVDMVVSQKRSYDVVLMDLQMPVMDGIEAIRRIRHNERQCEESNVQEENNEDEDIEIGGPACQRRKLYRAQRRRQLIVALSANSDSDTMQEALDAGADHFMSKPFTYDTFVEFVVK